MRIGVEAWRADLPSVDAARPCDCPRCHAPSREPGKPLGLHGHGLRRRQLRGPRSPDGLPEVSEILLRRYRCVRCGAVLTVAPAGVLRRRFFTAMAIALALGKWAIEGEACSSVRADISPWSAVGATASLRWNALRRWARAAARGELWSAIVISADWTRRELARRVARIVADRGPPDEPLGSRLFAGATQLR